MIKINLNSLANPEELFLPEFTKYKPDLIKKNRANKNDTKKRTI